MLLTVPENISLAVANLVRSVALSQFPSWRPFAYKFDNRASVLTVESIKEDPLSINSVFGSFSYIDSAPVELNAIRQEAYNISGEFTSEHLKAASNFDIIGDGKILTSFVPMTLRVYYIYAVGYRTEEQNRNLMRFDSNMVVVSSRHTSLDNLSYSFMSAGDGMTSITFNSSDDELIASSIKMLGDLFSRPTNRA